MPDKVKARGMVKAAIIDMQFIEKIPDTKESAQTKIRGIYENFRMLGDALMIAKGLQSKGPDHHFEMINELIKLKIETDRSLGLLHELRKLRHKINYEGYIPPLVDLEYAISIKKSLWKKVLEEVNKAII